METTRHRKYLNKRIRLRRERHVIDYLFVGLSNQQIADALGLKKHSSVRLTRDVRDEARDLGISLADLRKLKAPGVLS